MDDEITLDTNLCNLEGFTVRALHALANGDIHTLRQLCRRRDVGPRLSDNNNEQPLCYIKRLGSISREQIKNELFHLGLKLKDDLPKTTKRRDINCPHCNEWFPLSTCQKRTTILPIDGDKLTVEKIEFARELARKHGVIV